MSILGNSLARLLAIRSMLLAGLFMTAITGASWLQAAEAKKDAAKPATNSVPKVIVIPKSVFAEDTDPKKAKDPFFPDSVRRFPAPPVPPRTNASPGTGSTTVVAKTPIMQPPSKALAPLVLQGISGTATKRLATISGRSFEAGESGNVRTPAGTFRVTLVEILGRSVTIRVEGESERRELKLRGE